MNLPAASQSGPGKAEKKRALPARRSRGRPLFRSATALLRSHGALCRTGLLGGKGGLFSDGRSLLGRRRRAAGDSPQELVLHLAGELTVQHVQAVLVIALYGFLHPPLVVLQVGDLVLLTAQSNALRYLPPRLDDPDDLVQYAAVNQLRHPTPPRGPRSAPMARFVAWNLRAAKDVVLTGTVLGSVRRRGRRRGRACCQSLTQPRCPRWGQGWHRRL